MALKLMEAAVSFSTRTDSFTAGQQVEVDPKDWKAEIDAGYLVEPAAAPKAERRSAPTAKAHDEGAPAAAAGAATKAE